MDTLKGRIGARLTELREKRKLRVKDCAETMGISPKTWHDWANGNSLPDVERWPELAEMLSVPLRSILPKE